MAKKCSARNGKGEPCGNYPIRGATVCGYHGGKAPQVRDAARKRLLAAADDAASTLVAIIADGGEDSAVRVRAINSLLDRADVVGTKRVRSEVAAWSAPTPEEASRAMAALDEGTT